MNNFETNGTTLTESPLDRIARLEAELAEQIAAAKEAVREEIATLRRQAGECRELANEKDVEANTLEMRLGGKPARSRRARDTEPPSAPVLDGRSNEQRIVSFLQHSDNAEGETMGAIVGHLGGSHASVSKCVKAMLEAGTLTRTGEKRGTRYHAAEVQS